MLNIFLDALYNGCVSACSSQGCLATPKILKSFEKPYVWSNHNPTNVGHPSYRTPKELGGTSNPIAGFVGQRKSFVLGHPKGYLSLAQAFGTHMIWT